MSQQLLKEVARPPVIVGIDANGQAFRFYSGGVFTGENCGTNLNHAVTAIGYNEDANGKYWLIRNSWGQHWGEGGYMKTKRDTGDPAGQKVVTSAIGNFMKESFLSGSL
ncbi:hypothetical protein JHK87_003955 [Glycine soja]|nr:hypothetical protein JHK87_003955 [Glycine soja]